MATISEILRIEKETRANDPSNISKCYLFKEGSFIRAYEFSAWLLVNVVGDKSVNSQLKTTHKSLKDGTDFIFVGFPVVSTTKYIPSNIKIESVDDKQSIIDISELVPDNDENRQKILSEFQTWKDSIPVKEEKNKSEGNPSDRNEHRNVSLTMVFQQILGYDMTVHTPMEWGEFIKSLKADLTKIL